VDDAARLLQLVINGAAGGCIYGVIALGFVLIYKATEMINFAQGDLMMLGGFVALSLIANLGLNYWVGAVLAIAIMAVFGFLFFVTIIVYAVVEARQTQPPILPTARLRGNLFCGLVFILVSWIVFSILQQCLSVSGCR